ncbi:flagellar protein FliT [Noviherbaspirillum sp. CPCC 100848]|uniref:Flagellar protein FliT n=1 Tax=Noviherbaspirillum album TaxID=3080276 RepID=A0ABU6JJJ5_9BURK|nr:flagellar protein FliT [Noviherbaspirillum sp. CPCC 100848]MEC4723829.1 flagellar protein FliT [Noviherbaspirillum sp. CPCC 100848]
MTTINITVLLERYEAMRMLSRQMLKATLDENWDDLISSGNVRSTIAEFLQHKDVIQWDGVSADRKAEMIREILELDNKIREVAVRHMDQLHGKIGSINTEIKLKKAYE